MNLSFSPFVSSVNIYFERIWIWTSILADLHGTKYTYKAKIISLKFETRASTFFDTATNEIPYIQPRIVFFVWLALQQCIIIIIIIIIINCNLVVTQWQ